MDKYEQGMIAMYDLQKILENVVDPEIPVLTIADLGILRSVSVDEATEMVAVQITPTYNGCPAMDMIAVNIKAALQEHGIHKVQVELVLEPAWTTDWMSEAGKAKLMAYGISPPSQKTTDARFLMGSAPVVICPQCTSERTELVSLFGSTACKSLYKCLDCLEPFDYFKCH